MHLLALKEIDLLLDMVLLLDSLILREIIEAIGVVNVGNWSCFLDLIEMHHLLSYHIVKDALKVNKLVNCASLIRILIISVIFLML